MLLEAFWAIQHKADEIWPAASRRSHTPSHLWVETDVPWAAIAVTSALVHQALFWVLCYGLSDLVFGPTYSRLSAAKKVDWNSRIVSSFHAILAICFSVVSVAEHGAWNMPFTHWTTPLTHAWTALAQGYFTYDLALVLRHRSLFNVPILIHHTIGVWSYGYSVVYQVGITWGYWFLITEASTPFVNNRVFLAEFGMKDSKLYALNGLFMWIGFAFIRMPLEFITLFSFWKDSDYLLASPWMFQITLYLSWIGSMYINTYWTWAITKGLIKLLFSGDGDKNQEQTSSKVAKKKAKKEE